MALGTTNISLSTVKTLLGESSNSLFTLSCSPNINKWSKYKPVIGTWPTSNTNNYSLDSSWNYLAVHSGYPGRLGDFRGYEHSLTAAFPSIQCRNTDLALNATLYPSGTPYTNIWYCRAWNNTSAVYISPTDLGLQNYYVGLKLATGGATWYKTFGQVNTLVDTKTWNMSISAELIAPNTYSNMPYGTGTCNWQLILCSTEASTWINGAPSNIIYFPTGTDGTNTWVTSGSFTVANWLSLSNYSMTFTAAASYQESTVTCSYTGPPDFTIADDMSWATTPVYSGGTLISNPSLYTSGMTIRVTVPAVNTACTVSPVVGTAQDWTLDASYSSGSLIGGFIRTGTVTVTSDITSKTISVTQGATGSNQLTFSFRSVSLGAGDTPINVVITRGLTTVFSDTTGTYVGRDGYTKTYTVTINETGISGETYTVTLTRHV